MANNINDKMVTRASFASRYGNVITIGLWVIALSSHAFLLPKFLRDIKQ